ncbi:MAG: hypothetical protein RIB03_01510 [Henriciella sp.]|uniref:hypothetical protein n=1 Tax=Henriciella sp. TaxID=1968823 RepID=UPI00262091FD|nr:hypothetical protein [Henriciella sp.]
MWGKTGLAALMAIGAASGGIAQESERPKPCDSPPYHAFDFWLGEWTVTDPAEELAGTNSITKEEDGCLIVERWSGASGSTGQSYNYYDPGDGKWHQLWVSPGAVIDYKGGINQRGHMMLEGEIKYRGGDTHPFRGSWVPNEDGSVTQHFEQFNAESEEWDDWFIGTYRKE